MRNQYYAEFFPFHINRFISATNQLNHLTSYNTIISNGYCYILCRCHRELHQWCTIHIRRDVKSY